MAILTQGSSLPHWLRAQASTYTRNRMPLSPELTSWRKAQRATLLEQRMAVAQEQRGRWNAQLTHYLLAALDPLPGMVVAGYWPLKGEFDPRFLMRAWREAGARTALPVVLRKAAPLQFRDWWPGMRTSAGVYDLPVPEEGDIVTPRLALVPPIGFDAMGYRLGYGGGYYDRTLAALTPRPLTIGVAFDISRIDTIHPQVHDIAMDFIATPGQLYQVTATGLQGIDAAQARAIFSAWMIAPSSA